MLGQTRVILRSRQKFVGGWIINCSQVRRADFGNNRSQHRIELFKSGTTKYHVKFTESVRTAGTGGRVNRSVVYTSHCFRKFFKLSNFINLDACRFHAIDRSYIRVRVDSNGYALQEEEP